MALILGACGDDDESVVSEIPTDEGSDAAADDAGTSNGTEAVAGDGTEAEPGKDEADDTALVDAGASGSVGGTSYSFEPADGTFCKVDESLGYASISGLVDEDTGAELTIDYSTDDPGGAVVGIREPDGANWESSGVVTFPPLVSIDSSTVTATGEFRDGRARGDAPSAMGSIIATC